MPGIRGLKRCLCDANRVFGWSARPKPLFDELGEPIYTSFLYEAFGVIMPAVNAPYVVARGGVPVGGTPKPDASFAVGLPEYDPLSGYEATDYESRLSDVHGAKVVYDDDGTPWSIYVVGKSYDVESGVLAWGDGTMSKPIAFVVSNLRAGGGGTYYLPVNARISLGHPSEHSWNSIIPYGLTSVVGGGYVWHPACMGFSRDTVVICDNNRVQDGLGNVIRYRFSTEQWSAGYGESATTSDGAFICMPAQMSGDGQPWVVAKEYNTKQLFTGKWLNTLGYHNGNPPVSGVAGSIADLPAVLTASEQLNRHDNKTGWDSSYLDWTAIAYTRRNGYDYLIVRPQDVLGYRDNIYYDGRRNLWSSAAGYKNIYAFENGDVVLASCVKVKYVNADGTQRWLWEAPGPEGYGPTDPGDQPFLSGNSEVIQVKNVAIVGPSDVDLDLIDEASTADLDERHWYGALSYYYQPAITLSREGNPPTCVIHRSLERVNDPGAYMMNFYATNETLDAKYNGTQPQTHRAFSGRQVGGMSFDCVPNCPCACSLSGQIAY